MTKQEIFEMCRSIDFPQTTLNDVSLITNFNNLKNGGYLIKDAAIFLKEINTLGLPIYAVTNGATIVQKSRLEKSGILKYLKKVYISEEISLTKLSRFLQSIIILIIAISNIDVNWNLYKIITLIFMLLSSILIFLGLFILAAAYCFVTIKGLEVRNVFTDGGKHMAQYPIGIFRKGIVVIFTFIIPYGFVNYYPLLYILGKKSSNLYVISPLITIIYLIPCIIIFYKGVKKYSGVGS